MLRVSHLALRGIFGGLEKRREEKKKEIPPLRRPTHSQKGMRRKSVGLLRSE